MPFDYDDYQQKCAAMTTEQLHKEWENYTRQIAGGATSTGTSVLFAPVTGGISLMGLGLSAPRIHNARKKRAIIEAGLQARGDTHNTRKRDVVAPMAIAGAISGLTLGLAGPVADAAAGAAVGHGIEYAASHVALDTLGATAEHKHDKHSKKKADQKLQTQYQKFEQQYTQQQQQQQQQQQIIASGLPQQARMYQPTYKQPMPDLKPPQTPQLMAPMLNAYPQVPPPYQPPAQPLVLDQKYENVPVPAPQNPGGSYQPASHQQIFTQPPVSSQVTFQPLPAYALIHHSATYPANHAPPSQSTFPSDQKQDLTTATRHLSISQNVDVQTIPYNPTSNPPSVPIQQVAVVTETQTTQVVQTAETGQVPTLQVSTHELHGEVVTQTEVTEPLTMEQEIAFLKAQILQMMIEKRETETPKSPQSSSILAEQQPLAEKSDGIQEIEFYPPASTIIPIPPTDVLSPAQVEQPAQSLTTQKNPLPPPPVQAPSYQAPTNVPNVYSPQPVQPADNQISYTQQQYQTQAPTPVPTSASRQQQQQQQYTQPAPTPIQQYQTQYIPPPPPRSPALYQQQNPPPPTANTYSPQAYYPPPPLSPQPHFQPQYQRADSGYYSRPPTRTASVVSNLSQSQACYTPSSTLSPQPTRPAPYNPRQSISSIYTPLPISPQQSGQQAYYPPPPPSPNMATRPVSVNLGNGKDYFNQGYGQYQGTQGWQWGTAPTPVGSAGGGGNVYGEPSYGPPPAVPQPWKGS